METEQANGKTPLIQEDLTGGSMEVTNRPPLLANDQGGGNNLEKVRDLLFGGQLRDFEKRFSRLEERIGKVTAELRDELKKSLTSLETYVKKEIESLNDRFQTESSERTGAVKTLSLELKALSDFSWQKLNQLDEQATKNLRELRVQLLDQTKVLSEDMRQKHADLSTMIEQTSQELHENKTDRAALAALFTEVALRLNSELHLSSNE